MTSSCLVVLFDVDQAVGVSLIERSLFEFFEIEIVLRS